MSQRRPMGDDEATSVGASKNAKRSSFLPLPDELAQTGAIVNVKNDGDEECFKWSVLAALHPDELEPDNVHSYVKYEIELNFDGMYFPMRIEDIPQFETQNSIYINCFGYDAKNNAILPVLITKKTQGTVIDMMVISDDKTVHYSWIKDFSALINDKNPHHCRYCLQGFESEDLRNQHRRLCQLFEPQMVEFPSGDNTILKYKNPKDVFQVPCVIYADFECIQPKVQNQTESNIVKLTHHQPSGFAYKVVGPTDGDTKPVMVYRGDNVVQKFMEAIKDEAQWLKNKLKKGNNSGKGRPCFTCNDQSSSFMYEYLTRTDKHTEHICWKCNKKYNEQVVVVFHNLKNYDGHFIMTDRQSANACKFCISQSIDTYMGFTIGSIKFIDSLLFLKDSLEIRVSNLAADKVSIVSNFKHTFSWNKVAEDKDKLDLLVRKQVYPYDYMDSLSKFEEKHLPSQTEFGNSLTDKNITEEDYQHARNVWNKFNIQNLGEYHDFYVQSDVLLLADVFEHFRKMCLVEYELDLAYFYSLSGLSWDAALKMQLLKKPKLDLHLLTDREMYLMIESGIRGGVAMTSQRLAKANNPYLPGYDSTKPTKYIIYLDANNLYGWAMSQHLPTGGFTWLSPEEIVNFKIEDKQIDATTGYILEVDLDYPEDIHDDHNDYPLAPEKIEITNEMLLPFVNQLFGQLEKKDSSVPSLVPNLRKKEKYVVHYRTLKLYIKLGLKLTKIYRIVSFQQSLWLKPYIDYNIKMRKKATNKSDSDLFKLMNNSVYGKTFQNVRKYRDLEFLTEEAEIKKYTSQVNCQEKKTFSYGFTAVLKKKSKIILDKPIYIGFSVLDISKAFIYDFHYNVIRKKYKDKAKLLFTDTDSLCYEIETEDVYEDINNLPERDDWFDTSSFPKVKKPNDVNKMVVGKMKDETNGEYIAEFVGLKPKMYSLKYVESGKKCAVGIDKNYRERKLSHEDYKNCVISREQTEIEQVKITSVGHEVYTVRERRLGLTPYDDKRYILADGIHTLAYGNKKIADEKFSEAATPM